MISRPRLAFWLVICLLSNHSPGLAQSTDRGESQTAALEGDQTLEDLALKLYQDKNAADEIRALNSLPKGAQPKPGHKFKLPGNDRQPAISALNMASQAVKKAEMEGAKEYVSAKYEEALTSLAKAQKSCRKADYLSCQKFADETWALARMATKQSRKMRSDTNRFSVSVDPEGATTVVVSEGDGVQVSAQNRTIAVKRGQGLRVDKGKEPQEVRRILNPPKQVLPFPGSKLLTTSIQFHWKPVHGAVKYVLLIAKDATGRQPVRQVTTPDTFYLLRSSLPDGKYFWFLRSVDSLGLVGKSSPAKSFVLSTKSKPGLKIEGHGTNSHHRKDR